MDNLIAWSAILVVAYWLSPLFRRAVNGWIVQVADKVRQDADVASKPLQITDQEIADLAGVMFRADFPDNLDIERGFEGLPPAVEDAYRGRARAFLNGQNMDDYAASVRP